MKRLAIALIIFAIAFPSIVSGAGSCVEEGEVTVSFIKDVPTGIVRVIFTCIGGRLKFAGTIAQTPIPDYIINYLIYKKPYYLYRVVAYPTPDGVAPDAANVFAMDGEIPLLDLLGSENGGTTAWAGLNLINPTLTRSTPPNIYLPRAGLHANYFPEVTGGLSLKVSGQVTECAEWTVEFVFVEGDK